MADTIEELSVSTGGDAKRKDNDATRGLIPDPQVAMFCRFLDVNNDGSVTLSEFDAGLRWLKKEHAYQRTRLRAKKLLLRVGRAASAMELSLTKWFDLVQAAGRLTMRQLHDYLR